MTTLTCILINFYHSLIILGARNYLFAYFGKGIGPLLMDHVECSSNEPRLNYCSYQSPQYDDTHNKDVGVACLPR